MEEYYSDLFYNDSAAMVPTLLRPKSRGSITVRSTDPFDQPNIDPNILADPEDLEFFVRASRFCVEILETNAMKSVGAKLYAKPFPGCRHQEMGSDDYWRCYARHLVSSFYHSVGTCKMAPDSDPMGIYKDEYISINFTLSINKCESSLEHFINRKKVTQTSFWVVKVLFVNALKACLNNHGSYN
ncbi:Glucose dehydrogenase [FAD, quinone] [Armadillidium nasatum]|uniref:Glucose dehydrogenase [FAD, quinone] n=1 Tax=Armadillidium nasatum TaxID=96803 RepID=A0A5N5SK57_9CRUS|nr:Glucose dehydrogenase [FAD, quinone] [Armadillidium nasatum]